MSDEYYLPCTAKLLAEIASIRRYSEEQEAARAERAAANATKPPQPTLAEIMEAIQKLMAEIVQLRVANNAMELATSEENYSSNDISYPS